MRNRNAEIVGCCARAEKADENLARQILCDGLLAEPMVDVAKNARRVCVVDPAEF